MAQTPTPKRPLFNPLQDPANFTLEADPQLPLMTSQLPALAAALAWSLYAIATPSGITNYVTIRIAA
jgi:hypothetical protein